MLMLTTGASHAVLLDWAAQSWTAGSLTGSYDLDGVAGNDIQISIVSSGVTFVKNYPQNVSDPAIESGTTGLQLWTSAGFTNTTNKVTVTITFLGTYATGAYVQNLTLFDVDASGTFIDRVTFTALNGAAAVALNASNNAGTPSNTITGSGTTSVVAQGITSVGNITTTQGDVFVNSGGAKVTSITFVWNNPGPNFAGQAIDLGNITFTPEVGSGFAALLLCGGLLAFGRRRQFARRAAA